MFVEEVGEVAQAPAPVPLERVKPFLDAGEWRGREVVEPLLPAPLLGDELRLAQHPEVLGHGRAAEPEQLDDLAHGTRPAPQRVKDLTAHGIREGGEGIGGHAPRIRRDFPTYQVGPSARDSGDDATDGFPDPFLFWDAAAFRSAGGGGRVADRFEWPDDDYTRLLAEHGDRLTRLAFLLTGNRADAEDAVQDAVISVAGQWRRIAKSSPVGYLRTAVTRRAIDIVRRRRSLPLDELLDLGTADTGYLRLEADLEFVRLLQELPEKQRAVLVLRYHQQLDDRDIGRVLGCTAATVRSQASRALAKLREGAAPSAVVAEPIRGGGPA